MPSFMEVGFQSFQELGTEFLATVFGAGPTGQTSLICGASNLDDSTVTSSLQTSFYLDIFGTEDCAGTDWVVILIIGLIVHAISWLTRWLLWEPLANARMKGHPTWDMSECHRFSQTATSLLFFVTSAFFAARILLSKEWLFSREGWPVRGPMIDADYKFYYLLYAARFFSDLVSIFFEDRKLDAFIAAFIHHLVTLGLVLGSAHVSHTRYGGIIMFFFDWADIPLLSAKLFKYLSKDPKDSFQFIANRLFESFAIFFLLTRNGYYNYVVYAAWMDAGDAFDTRVMQYLLLLLVGLQTYWLYLVLVVVVQKQKNGGNAEDIREKKVN